MGRFIDLTGQKFGKLTVLEVGERRNHFIFWKCLCECGNKKNIRGSDLKKGATRSCGCLLRRKGKVPGNKESDRKIALLKSEYSRLKLQAKRRGIPVMLSFEEFSFLVIEPCHYCGETGSKKKTDYDLKRKMIISNFVLSFNGIDRKDSLKGYTKDNSVACCTTCNTAKNNMALQEFIQWLERVYNHNSLLFIGKRELRA